MASRGRAFVVVALLVALVGASFGFAQTAPAGGADRPAATRPAATTARVAPSLLKVVPADAWGVVGINDLKKFDEEVIRLAGKLALPLFFQPSGMLQMALGITEGFDPRGGMAMIFLDKMKYGEAGQWQTFNNLPAPMVLAVAATDPQVLIKAMGGKPAEGQEGLATVMLGQETVLAAAKGNYVLLAPDAALVKDVAGVGAPATRPVTAALPASLAKQIDGANLFVLVNIKPIATALDPMVRGLLATLTAMAQAAQAQAGAGVGTTQFGSLAGAYFDILSKQVDKLVVLGNLDADGLMLSGVMTFQAGTLLNKVFTTLEPADEPLVAGLPDGQFLLAAGSVKTGPDYTKELADLFSKPMLETLKSSGEPAMVAAAEQQTKIMNLRIQLSQMQQSGRLGVYLQPDAKGGLLAAVASGQFTDGAKAYDLIKQIAKTQVDALVAQQPKAKDFMTAVTYTPEAETVDSMKVHVLLLDMTKLGELLPEMSQEETEKAIKVVKTLLGTDGLTVRIAVGEKSIVASLGGGTAALKKAVDAAKSNAAPLARQGAIAKIQDRLPKNRVGVLFLSVENLLTAANQAAKALDEKPMPIEPGPTSMPVAAMMLADPAGLHASVYVPTELMVNVRGMVNQSMRQGAPRDMDEEAESPATRPVKPQAEPKPEF